jgi:hypothetical protein
MGTADAEVDFAIHGEPAGTPGLLEISPFLGGGGLDGVARTNVIGLTSAGYGGRHGGLYNFIYEQPFRLSATVFGGCDECGPDRGSAGFDAPFYVYDLDMNLLQTIRTPSDAEPAPEPATITSMIVGLAFVGLAFLFRAARVER